MLLLLPALGALRPELVAPKLEDIILLPILPVEYRLLDIDAPVLLI